MGSNPTPTRKLTLQPMDYQGSLDHLSYFEVTPIIGREYPEASISDMLSAPNSEQQIRDLAVVINERGVVFFRAPQDDLSVADQKRFTDLLGKLSGRPAENGLHVHPAFRDPANLRMPDGTTDENIYVINTRAQKEMYKSSPRPIHSLDEPKDPGKEWHNDATFEVCPSDYSCLLMEEAPPTGGDTLWCSSYELYDRVSPSLRAYLSTLTAHCSQPVFGSAARANGYEITTNRGSPLNSGTDFAPMHPVVRTNRVTGWRCLWAGVGIHVSRLDGVYANEDRMLREYILGIMTRGHDMVARMRWTPKAVAVWSNSATYHAATPDTYLVPNSDRVGRRTSSIGEKPYLDAESVGRREALGLDKWS